MRRHSMRIFLALGVPACLWAQLPVIYPHSIVNAASFHAPGLPAGSIARGSIFSIFGTALGPTQGAQVSAFPLQNSFKGVSITVTQGSTVVNALPLFVRKDQINALMPSNTPLGWVSVRVRVNNAPSNPSPVYVVNDSVGIFTATGTGFGPGAVHNFVSTSSQPANSTAASATPGQVVTLFATGLGPVTVPDNQAPPTGSLPTQVEAWVGGIPVEVSYRGRSPCCAGLDQITFTVPPGAPQGCWVPVQIRTSHSTVSNFVSMSIDPGGAACSDPSNPLSAAIVKGGTLGLLQLGRLAVHQDVGVNAPIDVTNDVVGLQATKQAGGPAAFLPFLSLPPPGTCTVYPGIGDFLETGAISETVSSLDAGTKLTVLGAGSPQTVALSHGFAALGSYLPLYSLPNQLYLSPGNYTVNGSGGADVGALHAAITVPDPITWTNRDQITIIDRSQGLRLFWSGAAAGQPLTVFGVDSDLPTNSSAMFLCTTPAGASSFTIPPEVLSAILPSRPNALASKAVIYLELASAPVPFSAPGLATAFASASFLAGKTVIFH